MLTYFLPDTQQSILKQILQDINLYQKNIFAPCEDNSTLVEFILTRRTGQVLSSSPDRTLYKTLSQKCKMIGFDFFDTQTADVRNVDCIVLCVKESFIIPSIKHAYDIAPVDCKIICLCYPDRFIDPTDANERQIAALVEHAGQIDFLWLPEDEMCNQHIGFITLTKSATNISEHFKNFSFEEEPAEEQENGLVKYNIIRDLVNRFNHAIKLHDVQLATAVRMNNILSVFTDTKICLRIEKHDIPGARRDFKKELQKEAWKNLFTKLQLNKYSTKALRRDIDKFVEEQYNVTFTTRNIHQMLEVVIGTTSERMDRALEEAFDLITKYHDKNRYYLKGWKTNSHFLVGKKFILPHLCPDEYKYHKSDHVEIRYFSDSENVEDLVKALCFLTGERYDKVGDLYNWVRYPFKVSTDAKTYFYTSKKEAESMMNELYQKGTEATCINSHPVYGEWFDFAFWRCKGFKNGSMHFEFKDDNLWMQFNQHIARLKGYPLFEGKEQTAYQKKQTGRPKNHNPLF